MKKENLIIGAIAVIGALTLFNTYKIFTKKSRTIPTLAAPSVQNNQGANFPNTNPQNNFQNPTQPAVQPQQPAAPVGPTTSINFKSTLKNFGKIKQNSTNNTYTFEFTNTGTEPLVISNAKGSCGCTVPKWPKEPIAPGETGKIDVDYKPGMQSGVQNKTVTVTANTDPVNTTLKIMAEVQVDPNAPQPSIQGQPQPQAGTQIIPQ